MWREFCFLLWKLHSAMKGREEKMKKLFNKKSSRRIINPDRAVTSSVITVRISDGEKERIDNVMMDLDIKRYSDVMRMALHMVKPDIGYNQVSAP